MTDSGGPTGAGEALLRSREGVARVQEALDVEGVGGWLLFDFHGRNPVAEGLLGAEEQTRRYFVLVPPSGDPVALVHGIELDAWKDWPWQRRVYTGWRELEASLGALLEGVGSVAMEHSPGSAVPTVDLVPGGTVEMVRDAGVAVESSGDLVARFYARWSDEELVEHRETAAIIAGVAADAFGRAAEGVRSGEPLREGELARWVLEAMDERGAGVDADCIVAVSASAANPHFQVFEGGEEIVEGELLLIDLWGKPSRRSVYADQTWMAYLGDELPGEAGTIWTAIRDARDAGVEFLRERAAADDAVRGYEVDDVVRGVVADRGYGEYFIHRTGHSIDREVHGSGANLDHLETRDERTLIPGTGFSIEPGVYIPDRVGMRTEINVYWGEDGPEVTSPDPQETIPLLLA